MHLKLSQRLGLGYGLVLVLLMAVASLALRNQFDATERVRRIVEVDGARNDATIDLMRYAGDTALAMRNLSAVMDPEALAKEYRLLRQALTAYDEHMQGLQAMLTPTDAAESERTLLQRVSEAGDKAHRILEIGRDPSATSTDDGDLGLAVRTELGVNLSHWNEVQADWMGALHDLRQAQVDRARESAGALQASAATARNTVLVLAGLALVVGVAAAVGITRSVVGPLRAGVDAANRMAGGDLAQPIESAGQDELGVLLRTLEHTRTQLSSLVAEVKASTDQMGLACREIASGNQNLSTRTQHTASRLQRTSASMDEAERQMTLTLGMTRNADEIAVAAVAASQRGAGAAADAAAQMDRLAVDAKRIGDIVGVIDGIAAQTGILSINAAVEAARAGELGRGFAVVAADVRTLAQRCTESAAEVKRLIGASDTSVQESLRLVRVAGDAMADIARHINSVQELMSRIAQSVASQSAGIARVNSEIGELDDMTQANAAMVEQTAAAADSLNQQAHRLVRAVGQFRVG